MAKLIKPMRSGARMLVHNSGFTLVAFMALALGIGANMATFSGTNSLPMGALPFREASSRVAVWEKSGFNGRNMISPVNYPDRKSRNQIFGDLAAVVDVFQMNLTGAGEPEELPACAVSANFFQRIGVQPIIGRAFLPAEDTRGRDHVAILSHQLWRRRFGTSVGIIGKSLMLSGELYEVVGVLPADFSWNNRPTDVWVPCVLDPNRGYRGGVLSSRAPRRAGRSYGGAEI